MTLRQSAQLRGQFRGDTAMSKAEVEHFRRRLLAMKKRLGGTLSDLEEEALRPVSGETAGGLSNVPIHPADAAGDLYPEEVALDLLENEQRLFVEVEDALKRIEEGTYGRCEECGQEIPIKRLEAVPYAHDCLRCAQGRRSTATK
jgi:RNA polymerase-binding protein DksA